MNGESAPETAVAIFLGQTPLLDGQIDEDFWRRAEKRRLVPSRDGREPAPAEGGEVGLGWNADGLYLAARLVDSALIATVREDERMHFKYGDVLELFLKPRALPCYWEMYVTPAGNKSTLYFRRPSGESPPDPLTGHDFRGLRVAARPRASTGKLAAGWDAEMWVPAAQLAASGERWGPGVEWTLFVGRYNHVASLRDPELSMWPPISRARFHLTDEYARLVFSGG